MKREPLTYYMHALLCAQCWDIAIWGRGAHCAVGRGLLREWENTMVPR